jgi:Replication-relaxation
VARSVAERAARAGSGLSAASIHWGMRGAAAKPVAVTERDRRLLALLHDLNYLSSSQMALLGWGGDSTCARRRLRLLHDRGLIDKFRPARAAGSYEWNYRLTVEGWRLIAERGMHAEDKQYKPADIHSIAYVEHDLQVNALVLDIAHRAWLGEGPLLDAMPFLWHGPRRGEIDPREDQRPEDGEPRARLLPRFFHGGSREGVIKPDATLIPGGQEPRQAVLVEYDRTARPHKQLERLRRYDWFLTEGWTRGRIAHHPVAPALVLVTLHESTLRALVKAADETLTASRGQPEADRRQRRYVGRERILFTTRERIICGDFRMLRAPSYPPELRKRSELDPPAPFYTREVEFDLVALASQPPDDALAD